MFPKKSLLFAVVLVGVIAVVAIMLMVAGEGATAPTAVAIDGVNETGDPSPETVVYIDSMTERRDLSPEECEELDIPGSITRYDVMVFDTKEIKEVLLRGEPLTLSLDGQVFTTDVREHTTDTEARSIGIHSFTGTLLDVEKSEVVLTVSDRVLLCRVWIDFTEYFIESTAVNDTKYPERVLHYAYCSDDVVPEGPPGNLGGIYLDVINISNGDAEYRDLPADSTEDDFIRAGLEIIRIDDTDLKDLPTVNRSIQTGEIGAELPFDEEGIIVERYRGNVVEYKGSYYFFSYWKG
ncbi:hypothetical protein J2129_002106 [Methanofollis sp. W23]|uniref:hypothetical protein n=1 Tax=Methanofollis sp. W23 TaxID=2817849 RepID=UPI001AE44639|nr:hypothetical protein [Methanofollis sp. W23]MBP2146652.1 hypothetical protein [Methanofollis sp. W23]